VLFPEQKALAIPLRNQQEDPLLEEDYSREEDDDLIT
jgi:hypothetical protein